VNSSVRVVVAGVIARLSSTISFSVKRVIFLSPSETAAGGIAGGSNDQQYRGAILPQAEGLLHRSNAICA
jgi:hypothetical protein